MYYYSGLLVAILAAVASAVQFDLPLGGLSPIEGQPIEISYSQADGPVTITLKNGPSDNLQTVVVIGRGPAGRGSITWTPENLATDTYALEIVDGRGINYSNPFAYQGTGSANTGTPSGPGTMTPSDATTPTTPPTVTSPMNTTMGTTTANTTTDATATTTEGAATTTEPINQNSQNSGNARLGSSMALALGAAALLATFN